MQADKGTFQSALLSSKDKWPKMQGKFQILSKKLLHLYLILI